MPVSPPVTLSPANACPLLLATADLYFECVGDDEYEASREELAEVGAVQAPNGAWSIPLPPHR